MLSLARPGCGSADLDRDEIADNQLDEDGDFVMNDRDNCRGVANPTQEDADRDGMGDACDANRDGDGVGLACDDGDPCTEGDTCGPEGRCDARPLPCADEDPCTADTCRAGICRNDPIPDCCQGPGCRGQIWFIAPEPGAVLPAPGLLQIVVDARGERPVAVHFSLDGAALGSAESRPFGFALILPPGEGNPTLEAKAEGDHQPLAAAKVSYGGVRAAQTDRDGRFRLVDIPAALPLFLSASAFVGPDYLWDSFGPFESQPGGELDVGELVLTRVASSSPRVGPSWPPPWASRSWAA